MFPPCGMGRSPWPGLHSSSPSASGREGCAPTTLCCWSWSPWCPWSPRGEGGAWSPWLGAALGLLSCGFGGAACGRRVPPPLRLPWGPCSQQAMPSPPPASPTCLTPPPLAPQQRTPDERWCACCNRCRAHVITHTACRAAPLMVSCLTCTLQSCSQVFWAQPPIGSRVWTLALQRVLSQDQSRRMSDSETRPGSRCLFRIRREMREEWWFRIE